jgi:hypothetical protein
MKPKQREFRNFGLPGKFRRDCRTGRQTPAMPSLRFGLLPWVPDPSSEAP